MLKRKLLYHLYKYENKHQEHVRVFWDIRGWYKDKVYDLLKCDLWEWWDNFFIVSERDMDNIKECKTSVSRNMWEWIVYRSDISREAILWDIETNISVMKWYPYQHADFLHLENILQEMKKDLSNGITHKTKLNQLFSLFHEVAHDFMQTSLAHESLIESSLVKPRKQQNYYK